MSRLTLWWARRPVRERRLMVAALVLVVAALLWAAGIAPAWHTVQAYPAQRAVLDAQLRTMQDLQARAHALRDASNNLTAANPRAMEAALRASVASVASVAGLGGRAQLLVAPNQSQNPGQAVVTLKGVDAADLAQWLARTRRDARMLPSQAQLRRDGSAWSGTVTFMLAASRNAG